jgi:hypothetical protein
MIYLLLSLTDKKRKNYTHLKKNLDANDKDNSIL